VREPSPSRERADRRAPTLLAAARGSRLLILITFLVMITIAAIVTVATESWWALVAAVVIHGLATIAFLVAVVATIQQVEQPDPSRAALLEAQGVLDPEREIDERVRRLEQRAPARPSSARDDAA